MPDRLFLFLFHSFYGWLLTGSLGAGLAALVVYLSEGSTEKAIYILGKIVIVLLGLVLCLCVGWSSYQIKVLGDDREALVALSAKVDKIRKANSAEEPVKEKFIENIRRDWDNPVERVPLRQSVFYPKSR